MPATAAPYFAYDVSRFMMGMAATQAHMTAAQTTMMLAPWRMLTSFWSGTVNNLPDKVKLQVSNDVKSPAEIVLSLSQPERNWTALADAFNRYARPYPKIDFNIHEATIQGVKHPVKVTKAISKPFADLLHFDSGNNGPALYIAAPISGHYATLIEDTVQSALNGGFQVYVYDTKSARDVPLSAGRFGMDELIDYHREFMQHAGPKAHVIAICQATVSCLTAMATLRSESNKRAPASLTVMAGPIVPHITDTAVSRSAQDLPPSVFKNMLMEVPAYYPGAGRLVRPGFAQIGSFASMNLPTHFANACAMFNHHVLGTTSSDQYARLDGFDVEFRRDLDIPGELFDDTIEFFRNGIFKWRGKPVDLSAIDCPFLTYEAAKDDICSEGQTMAAHEIVKTPESRGEAYHFTLPDAGHYGAFAGSKARLIGLPVIFSFIHKVMDKMGLETGPVLDGAGHILQKNPDLRPYTKDMLSEAVDRQKDEWATRCNETKKDAVIAMCTPVRTPLARFELAA